MHSKKDTLSLWIVLFVIFLDWIGIGMVYPMFSSMLFSGESPFLPHDASEATRGLCLGILLAAMPFAQFFFSPVMGTLSDAKGRRPLFLFSLSLAIVGYALSMISVFFHSLALLIFSRLVIGIAAGNAAVVTATVADVSTEHNKAKNFGLLGTACGLGFTLGPFLGGKFSETSFMLPFLVALVLTAMNLIGLVFIFRETNMQKKDAPISFSDGLNNIKKACSMHGVRTLFLTILIFSLGWSFFYEFIPVVWMSHYGFTPATVGLLYAYGSCFYALSASFLIHPIVKRYTYPPVIFYALGFLGFLILALLSKPSANWIWVYLPLVNFFVALLEPTSTAMVSDAASKDNQGEVLGIFQSVQSVAWCVSPLLAGPLLGIHIQMPMLLGGLAILLAALILGWFLKHEVFSTKKKNISEGMER